jgi:hypothetical protein
MTASALTSDEGATIAASSRPHTFTAEAVFRGGNVLQVFDICAESHFDRREPIFDSV